MSTPTIRCRHYYSKLKVNNTPYKNYDNPTPSHQKPNFSRNIYMDVILELRKVLEADLVACDAKWTLFVAAALSYRYESLLSPFPEQYISGQDGVDIEALIADINNTPALLVVLAHIRNENYDQLKEDVIALLYWVLIEQKMSSLRLITDEEYDQIIAIMPKKKKKAERPTHVFEINTKPITFISDMKMLEKENDYEWCYYSSKLDTFYKIINLGFPSRKGTPLILRKDLTAAISESPYGAGWGASACGSMIACVALCACPRRKALLENSKETDTELLLDHSDDINEVLRLRYLLFYGSRFTDGGEVTRNTAFSWLQRHKYRFSLAGCYTLFLASICFANSCGGPHFWRMLGKKLRRLLDL